MRGLPAFRRFLSHQPLARRVGTFVPRRHCVSPFRNGLRDSEELGTLGQMLELHRRTPSESKLKRLYK